MQLGCFPVSRANLFLERKRSAIDQALETFIEKVPAKNELEASKLTTWRESVLAMAKEKIEKLKQKIQAKQKKQYYVILMSYHI